jgi:hypothetical protein
MPAFARSSELIFPVTPAEETFIRETAFGHLNRAEDERSLEKLADWLWNLCVLERQRTGSLDAKAATLTGLSSLSAAVMALSASLANSPKTQIVLVSTQGISVALFIVTVLLSLRAQALTRLGAFLDADIFEALNASNNPVGITGSFQDANPYRCFLREVSIQRWLIYKRHRDANDNKAKYLGWAQKSAAIAVASLVVVLISTFT